MTIAVPGLRSSSSDELPLSFEITLVLLPKRAWLDIRHDAGLWYASLRIKEPCAAIAPKDGVNGFCDVWNGPHHTREAAMSNGYAFGRHHALKAHVPTAKQLCPRLPLHLHVAGNLPRRNA